MSLARRIHTSVLLVLLLVMTQANTFGATCAAVFPEAASSYSATGEIYFASGTALSDTDNMIDIAITVDASAQSCTTVACSYSGNTSGSFALPVFENSSSATDITVPQYGNNSILQGDYDDLFIENHSSLSITNNSVESRFDDVNIKNDATLTLDGGVYWISLLNLGNDATIQVTNGQNAIIYVDTFTGGNDTNFNLNGSEEQLTIVAMNDVKFGDRAQIRGYLYIQNKLTFSNDGVFYGAANAKIIDLKNNSKLYTRVANIESAEFDGMCQQTPGLPSPLMYYSMDMCAVPSGSDAINDDIGTNHGDTTGGASADYSGQFCQGVSLDGQESFIDIPDPAANDLLQGSISLYFTTPDLTHSNNPAKGYMGLLSRDASGTEIGGHLTIWITDSGGISIRQQDASSDYDLVTASSIVQENQWHHLVYTWGADGMKVYLDGVLRGQNAGYTGGLTSNGVDMAIGANTYTYQSSSGTSRKNQLKDFFIGSVDELRIYDEQLSQAQISTLNQVTSQDCAVCTTSTVLVAHWGADACSITLNQVVDVVSGIDATVRNGVTTEQTSRFCQGLSFSGTQSYATVEHNNSLEIANGAISLWFKLPDLSHNDDNYAGGNVLLAKDKINYGNGGHLEIRIDSAGAIQIRHQSTNQSNAWGTAALVQENQWHHLVYSFGSNGAKIYLDNQLVDSKPTYTDGWGTNNEVLVFGAGARTANFGETTASNFNDFLLGEMDQIKIYQNQANAADVDAWYNEAPSACLTCDSLVAKYTFDQANAQTSIIEDSSGNNNSGALGSSLTMTIPSNNVSCRAMQVLEPTGTSPDNYFDSGVDVNSLGNQGSISFWYKANAKWDDGVSRQLFDGTDFATAKFFFLVKLANGKLRLGLETADDNHLMVTTGIKTYAADTWVHISVQWNLVTKQHSIYLNGQDETVLIEDTLLNDVFPDFQSVVFGDNLTTYLVNGASDIPANGYIDDIKMYSQAISASQIQSDIDDAAPCQQVDHYLIEHPATALVCDQPQVTIKACADAGCTALSTFESSITLTPANFTPSSAVTFTGSTTVNLTNTNAGTLTLGSSSQSPQASVACSNNCEVAYESAGVQFFNTVTGQSSFTLTPFVAQDSLANVGLRIVGENGGACEGIVNGQSDITLAYECVGTNAVDYTPTTCNVPFAGIALSGGNSQSGTLTMSFDANGESNFGAYQFADAGILKLTASASINGAAIQAASAELSMIPDSLLIESSDTTMNTAGSPFSLSITAKGSNGASLPGFQSNALQLKVQRLIPSDGAAADAEFYLNNTNFATTALLPAYKNIAINFSNGIASTSTAYMEEVGTYAIDLQDIDYLGATIAANEVTFGRFVPAYFDVQKVHQPELDNTCDNTFTYIGDTFAYTSGLEPSVQLVAYNSLGQVTQNYADTLWRLTSDVNILGSKLTNTDQSTYSGSLQQPSALSSIVVSGTDQYDGAGDITASGMTYSYSKIALATGVDASPMAASLDLTFAKEWFTDDDGVCYQTNYPDVCNDYVINSVTGVNLRYGRVNMNNAFGPENEALALPISTEYLDDGQWRVNFDDNCSNFSLLQTSNDFAISHDTQSQNNLANMITDMSISSTVLLGVVPFSETQLGPFTVAGEAKRGSFNIELLPRSVSGHWSEFLNIDWDEDGDIDSDDTPSAIMNFGIYRGDERTLHWREVLN